MNIYHCVSENITEDDVIITEERISHIKKRDTHMILRNTVIICVKS